MNVATVKIVECVQVGENVSWAAPSAALLGTVKDSEKAPELLIAAVPSVVVPQPPTLIDEHPGQSVAEAVTLVPGGPCAGDNVGGLSSALAGSADTVISDSGTARTAKTARNTRTRRSIMTPTLGLALILGWPGYPKGRNEYPGPTYWNGATSPFGLGSLS